MSNDFIKNTVYISDSGMKSNRVEWRKIREGKVVVHGFPEDLNPAPASSFGREGLQKLLDDKVILSFQVAAGKHSVAFICLLNLLHSHPVIESRF